MRLIKNILFSFGALSFIALGIGDYAYANLKENYKKKSSCSYEDAQFEKVYKENTFLNGQSRKKGIYRYCITRDKKIFEFIHDKSKDLFVIEENFIGFLKKEVVYYDAGRRISQWEIEKNKLIKYDCKSEYPSKICVDDIKRIAVADGRNPFLRIIRRINANFIKDGILEGKISYVFDNGDSYQGDWKRGKANGKGTHISQDGYVKYIGNWVDGKRNGKGTLTTYNHSTKKYDGKKKYEGDWLDDKKHGEGTFITGKGDKYIGKWENDKLIGRVNVIWANGDKFSGDWVDGKKTKGTFIWANGSKYIGDWVDDKRTGKGIIIWANGKKYEGDWVDDSRTGKGILYFKNGKKDYEGDWVNNSKEGKGIEYFQNGKIHFEGDYVDNQMSYGTMFHLNGNKYVGSFRKWGIYNGKGTLTWANGSKYEGDFLYGKRHGKGTLTWANGDKFSGDWVDGKRNGKGTLTWADGDKYEGDFLNDKRHGVGTYIWANGEKRKGKYSNNSFLYEIK